MRGFLAAVLLIAAPGIASAQDTPERELKVQAGDGQRKGALGLHAAFDRPKPVYVPGETLGLTVSTERDATIEIWEVGSKGKLTRLLPGVPLRASPGGPLHLPLRGQKFAVGDELGTSELLIIAHAAAVARSVGEASADPSRPGASSRQEVRLSYRVVRP